MIGFDWEIEFGYYITYIGEIYHGIAIREKPGSDSFYILGKRFFKEYSEITQQEKIPPFLEKNGIYISTSEIIDEWIDEEIADFPISNRNSPWSDYKENYKTMYIFGAGASANCMFGEGQKKNESNPLRPPLGKELFADRFDHFIKKYPGLKFIISKFERGGNDIEAILEADWETLMKKRDIGLAGQHLQIQFFLQELFMEISTKYHEDHFRFSLPNAFAQNIAQNLNSESKPVIVSFNYDTLLDRAFELAFRRPFDDLDSYVSHGEKTSYLFFKPHGSCNWGWRFQGGDIPEKEDIATWIYQNQVSPAKLYYEYLGPGMITSSSWGNEAYHNQDGIGKITPNRDRIETMSPLEDEYFPALLLPYRDKDEFVMPYYHQLLLDQVIAHIEEMVIIGWKGNEKLFNSKIKKYGKKIKKVTIANRDFDATKNILETLIDPGQCGYEDARDFETYVLKYMS